MLNRDNIQIDLLKLAGGGRLLRCSDLGTGLALEKKLDPDQPVVRQREKLSRVFEAALASAALATD
jgi:hypothetical protein